MNLEQVKQSLKKVNDALGLTDPSPVTLELSRLADRLNTKSLPFFTKNNGIETTITSMETFPSNAEIVTSGCKLLSLITTSGTDQGILAILAENRGVIATANAFITFQHNREIELLCLRILAATAWRAPAAFSDQRGTAVARVILEKMKLNDKREALTGLRWGVLGGLSTTNYQVCTSVYEAFGVDGAVKALQSPASSDHRCILGCLGALCAFVANPATSQAAIGVDGLNGIVQTMKKCRGDLVGLECCYRAFSTVIKMPGNKCGSLINAKAVEEIENWIKLFAKNRIYKGICVCYEIFAQILRHCDVNIAFQMLQAGIIETLLDTSSALGSGGNFNGNGGNCGGSEAGTPEDITTKCVFVIRAALEKVLDGNRRVPPSVVAFFKDRGAKIAVAQLPSPAGIELIACLAEVSEVVPSLVKAGGHRALGDVISQAQGMDRNLEYACLALGRMATESKGAKISDAKIINAVTAAFRRSLENDSMLRTVCYTMAALLNDAPPEIYKLAVGQGVLDVAVAMLRSAEKNISACLNPCCIIKGCVRISLGLGTPQGSDPGSPPDYIGRIIKLNGIAAATKILRRALELAIGSGRTVWENFEARRAQVSVLEVLSLIIESPQHPEAKDLFIKDDGLILLRAILINAAAYEVDPSSPPRSTKANPKLRDCLWAERITFGMLRSIVEAKPEFTKYMQHLLFPEESDEGYEDECDCDCCGYGCGCNKELRPELCGRNIVFLILEQSYPEKEFVQQECMEFIVACLQQGSMSVFYAHSNLKTFTDVQKERISNPNIQVLTNRVILSVLKAIRSDENDSLKLTSEFLADNGEVNAIVAALTVHAQDIRVHIAGVELLAELFQFNSIKDKYLTITNLRAVMDSLARFPDVEEYQCAVLLLLNQLKSELKYKDEHSNYNDALCILVAALRNFVLNDTIRESSVSIISSFLGTHSTEIFPLIPSDFVEAFIMAITRTIEVNPYKSPLVAIKSKPPPAESSSSSRGRNKYFGELDIDEAFWRDLKVKVFEEESSEEMKMGTKAYSHYSEENSRETSVQLKALESLKAILYASFDKGSRNSQDALVSGFTKDSNNAKVMKIMLYNLVRWNDEGNIVANSFVGLKNLLQMFPALQEEAIMRYNAIEVILNASWKQKLYRANSKIHVQAFHLINTFLSPIVKSAVQPLSPEGKERLFASLERGDFIGYVIYVLDTYADFYTTPVAGETVSVLVTERPAVFCPLIAKHNGIDVFFRRMAERRVSYGTKYFVNVLLATLINDPHICITHKYPGLRELMSFVRNESTTGIILQFVTLIRGIIALAVEPTPKRLPSAIGGLRFSEVAFFLILLLNANKLNTKQTEDVLGTLNDLLRNCGEEVYARITSKRETFDSLTATIRNGRSQHLILDEVFTTVDMIATYLGHKNLLWRMFQPYTDSTGRPSDYKYLSPQSLGSTFQIIFYQIPSNHRAYKSCARLSDMFCSSPYYLAPPRITTTTVSPLDFSDVCTKNLDIVIEKASCGPNDKAHAISTLFTISKLSKDPFFRTCVGRNWGIRAIVRSLVMGLESPLCVNYAFAAICMAALEGDNAVRDLVATADATSVNLPLLFMTAMSLYPSTFGIQACGTLFLARCLAVFPDFVDRFLVPRKYETVKCGGCGTTTTTSSGRMEQKGEKERLFVRLIQLVTTKEIAKSPAALKYAVYILTNLLTTKSELLCRDPLGRTVAKRSIRVLFAGLRTFAEKTDVLERILLTLLAVVSTSASLASCVSSGSVARTMTYHDNNANIQSVGVALLGLLPRSKDPLVKCALRKSAEKFKDDLFIYNTSMDILRSYE